MSHTDLSEVSGMSGLAGKHDVYLYGMTVYSTIHLLEGEFPEADTYAEIRETWNIPGGETANSAVVLSKLGLKVKIDGPFLGSKTKDGIIELCGKHGIDCSGMHYDHDFEGVQDLVMVAGKTRTVFGRFGSYFSGEKKWNKPDIGSIEAADIVSLDPFFGEESKTVAEYCVKIGKKYVTIDCPYDGVMLRNAAATAISLEYIRNQYPGEEIEEIFKKYTDSAKGLVIFTFGSKEIMYGRRGEGIKRLPAYKVEVKSTLGAGDTFRGGVVYGVLKGFPDQETVKFAAATAACVCRRFPFALNPPSLEEIQALIVGG